MMSREGKVTDMFSGTLLLKIGAYALVAYFVVIAALGAVAR
jgi:hypothetical protein